MRFRDDTLFPLMRKAFWRPGVYGVVQNLRAVSWKIPGARTFSFPRELAVLYERQPARPSPPTTGRRILFFAPRGQTSTIYEVLVASAVRAQGGEAVFVHCGGHLPICSYGSVESTPPLPCTYCRTYNTIATESLDFQRLELRSNHDPHASFADVPAQELADVTYREVPIGHLVQFAAAGYLRSDLFTKAGVPIDTYRRFLSAAVSMVDACHEALDQIKPDRVFMNSGLVFPDSLMLDICAKRGIPVLTYAWGHRRNTLVFAWNKPACHFEQDEAWGQQRHSELAIEDKARIDDYLGGRRAGAKGAGDIALYWQSMSGDAGSIRQQLGLDAERPILSLFTNILWDAALLNRDVAFDGLRDWLLETIDIVGGWPEVQLVVRIHPAEVRLPMIETRDKIADFLRERRPELPPNVHVVPPESDTSSYALASVSDLALVYTSTMGLEMAAVGKPVVVAGKVHYARKGFTIDVDRRDDYADVLKRSLASPPASHEIAELATRYAHFFFFNVMVPFPLIDISLGNSVGVDTSLVARSASDPTVAKITDALLETDLRSVFAAS